MNRKIFTIICILAVIALFPIFAFGTGEAIGTGTTINTIPIDLPSEVPELNMELEGTGILWVINFLGVNLAFILFCAGIIKIIASIIVNITDTPKDNEYNAAFWGWFYKAIEIFSGIWTTKAKQTGKE